MKEVLAAARDNSELVKVPTVLVQDEDAGGLAGRAAVLGASNIIQWLERREGAPRGEGRRKTQTNATGADMPVPQKQIASRQTLALRRPSGTEGDGAVSREPARCS